MKSSIVCVLLLITGIANSQVTEPIFTRTVTLPVDISTARVVKTNKGYGETYLVKVLVPELAAETLMNHRNEGEGAPCLATYQADSVDQVVWHHPETIHTEFKIDLVKLLLPDPKNNVCKVQLIETVTTTIRGYEFTHERSSNLPDRVLEDCK
jgi:hypothetical protein